MKENYNNHRKMYNFALKIKKDVWRNILFALDILRRDFIEVPVENEERGLLQSSANSDPYSIMTF